MQFVEAGSSMKLKLKSGTTAAGKDKISSLSIKDMSNANATPEHFDALSKAIDDLTTYPVLETVKVVEFVVTE